MHLAVGVCVNSHDLEGAEKIVRGSKTTFAIDFNEDEQLWFQRSGSITVKIHPLSSLLTTVIWPFKRCINCCDYRNPEPVTAIFSTKVISTCQKGSKIFWRKSSGMPHPVFITWSQNCWGASHHFRVIRPFVVNLNALLSKLPKYGLTR